jgi:hypothetical protein
VSIAIAASGSIFKKDSIEKAKTLAYLVAFSQLYDFFWFCVYGSNWHDGNGAHEWALFASYFNFILKFAVFLSLWRTSN